MQRKEALLANKIYFDWFNDDMSPEAQKLAEEIDDTDDLEHHEPDLSAGEFDAIEAVLVRRTI